ncbi:MAG: VOC family protein [Hyphomicrobiales bacterium]|nr:VOC family protein [Hyphomicrobiales bacterium]MDE2115075.1 VOC family protein [Hyphomicrobiales bacterium]
MRLGYIILYVPDVVAAVEFYERAFGLARRFVHESGQYAEMETGATALAFAGESFVSATRHTFKANRPDQEPAGAEVAFVADDVNAAFEKAIGAGATGYAPPHQKPWGQTVAYVRDANGFLVELCSAISD